MWSSTDNFKSFTKYKPVIWYSSYHNYMHSFFKVCYKIKEKGHEDICSIIPAFYMHAVMKCKKNNADVSHNIQLSCPYKCPVGWTHSSLVGNIAMKNLTWRKTQWQLVIIIKFSFPFTCGYFLSFAVLEPY